MIVFILSLALLYFELSMIIIIVYWINEMCWEYRKRILIQHRLWKGTKVSEEKWKKMMDAIGYNYMF